MNREQPGLNVDFSQTTAEVCESCGNDTFVLEKEICIAAMLNKLLDIC